MKSLLMSVSLILLALTLNVSTSKNAHAQEKKVWVKTIDSVLVSEDVLNQAIKDAVVADKCAEEIKIQKKEATYNRYRGWFEAICVYVIYRFGSKYWKK